ncbi:3-dehydroquinate synthase [Larsenimonas suaedae]|uniref:3-dehydroquinate synthase n=1 Tax=Larsenimonas suaedae TaxID=1851019 RepID=A0ABU1GTM9_9GAMM|nr:3-dehydroquinate synthase [Larsenimonas suaedae]MCM2972272.1 3-dehydroquinate synthase [Larsenimonas suaedae]MDR5894932.1 3-dehydroquinate synthase [Larsenimonas suaedae]
MQTLTVDLDTRSYPIHVGPNLLERQELLAPYIGGRQVMIVTNETVAPLYLDKVKAMLPDHMVVSEVILPDGEQHKSLDSASLIWDALLEQGFNRRCTLIALGGGVIGDVTGFAAATYQRGVEFIQIPTTLLSQVDSSVGGKTGINHPRGKNMIGAFWQPRVVLADTATLETLPDREFSAGLAEVIKYGLIYDATFLEYLEARMDDIRAYDASVLTEVIVQSCQIKADVVHEDETEQGVRAILNLGHTFGHAIENALGYGAWLHGEAVSVGMLMAATLSRSLEWLDDDDVSRVKRLLESAGLPVEAPASVDTTRFIELMRLDKKNISDRLRLVLLPALGEARVTEEAPESMIEATIDHFPKR